MGARSAGAVFVVRANLFSLTLAAARSQTALVGLRIRLLGGVELTHDGAVLRVESGRVESLLAYLLLHRDAPQSRQHLAFLLWPDTTDAQARTNLRHVLHTLRRTLPNADGYLDVAARTLQWRPAARYQFDVAEFVAACDGARTAGDSVQALRDAVRLYRGELVPGCYDEWLLGERESHRQRYLDALRRLVDLLETAGEGVQGITYAERLLAADPLDEGAYRALMRLHAANGDRARALRVYHGCTSALEQELGVAPSAATTRVYQTLLDRQPMAGGGRPTRQQATLGASPFVARAKERATLTELWRKAETGRGSLVLVVGEPGIGKTRLVEDFRSWCAQRGAATAQARSYAAEGELAYGPVVAWLRSPDVRGGLRRLGREQLTELARLLPELLVEMPDLPRPEPLTDSEQRHRMLDAVALALRRTGRPLLLVGDDLHWADRETLQFLHLLLRGSEGTGHAQDSTPAVLAVATARSGVLDPDSPLAQLVRGARSLDRLTEIELAPLSPTDSAVLAGRLTGAALDESSAARLWRETEGNPLFLVEAVRAGWPDAVEVSQKVQAVIESRLAELSAPARDLVGLAATIGRDFTVELLAEAGNADEDTLVASLDELWRRRIVREQGGSRYDFSHDKIRAVAYAGVGPVRRRHHHLRIARALEPDGGNPSSVSGQIATHYEHAGVPGAAADWYARAAGEAQQLQANAEAIRLLERSRSLLTTLPPSGERDLRELALLTALPAPLASVEGYASPRLSAVHDRAVQLAGQSGSELAPPLLWSLAFASLVHDDYPRAERFAAELRDRGERVADQVLVVEGCALLGLAAFWQADLDAAKAHLERAVDRYRPEQLTAHLLRYGQDPEVMALARLGNIAWLQGDATQAVRRRDAAMARAHEIGHPLTTAAAWCSWACWRSTWASTIESGMPPAR